MNNIIEQQHRPAKSRTRPTLGFKNFRCGRLLLGSIELTHVIVKEQMDDGRVDQATEQQFYSLWLSILDRIATSLPRPRYRDNTSSRIFGAYTAQRGRGWPVKPIDVAPFEAAIRKLRILGK